MMMMMIALRSKGNSRPNSSSSCSSAQWSACLLFMFQSMMMVIALACCSCSSSWWQWWLLLLFMFQDCSLLSMLRHDISPSHFRGLLFTIDNWEDFIFCRPKDWECITNGCWIQCRVSRHQIQHQRQHYQHHRLTLEVLIHWKWNRHCANLLSKLANTWFGFHPPEQPLVWFPPQGYSSVYVLCTPCTASFLVSFVCLLIMLFFHWLWKYYECSLLLFWRFWNKPEVLPFSFFPLFPWFLPLLCSQVLDEVQAYILLDRFLEPSDAIPSTEDRSFLQSVSGCSSSLLWNFPYSRQCGIIMCFILSLLPDYDDLLYGAPMFTEVLAPSSYFSEQVKTFSFCSWSLNEWIFCIFLLWTSMSLSLIWHLEFQVDLADTKESKDIPLWGTGVSIRIVHVQRLWKKWRKLTLWVWVLLTVSEEGEIMIAHQAMSEEVKQLLKDGLENATYASLKERLAAATQPEHLVTSAIFLPIYPLSYREGKYPWLAIETGLEQSWMGIRRGIGEFLFGN